MIAAIAAGLTGYVRRPQWACVIYLYVETGRTLTVDDGVSPLFGYEVLLNSPTDAHTAIPERLDQLLVASRRHAKLIAAHDAAEALAALAALGVDRRLPGVDGVRQQWTARSTRMRTTANVIDTAHDIGRPGVAELSTLCENVLVKAISVAAPAADATMRQILTHTLAIALVAARAAGFYDWSTPLDLDGLVHDGAWDHLDAP